MSADPSSFKVGIEFESVLRAISKQIYETPHAFIRENIQNAIDAVRIQALRDGLDPGHDSYRIEVIVDGSSVSVRDNGIGMSRAHLRDYFWTIGSSGKRGKEAHDAGCVGMFGIGGFANFGVCDTLQVTSQDVHSPTGTCTRLSAADIRRAGASIPSVSVRDSDAAAPRGTIVRGQLGRTPDPKELNTYLKGFVRFVPIAITFNGEPISQQRFADIEDRQNLTPIAVDVNEWRDADIVLVGRIWEDRGHTIVVAIEGMRRNGDRIPLVGQLRFENGSIDVFKRGFKLCATQVPSAIGISGRLDCDLFVPTAGRDSLDAATTGLLGRIGALMEIVAVDTVLESSDRIAQHTRIFRLITRRGLIQKLDNVPVRLADGTDSPLGTVKQRATEGEIGVFFGTTQKHALNQVMQAQGHIVVQLSSDRYRRRAEQAYLERYCQARPFEGIIECTEVYRELSLFERIFLSEIERNIAKSYEIASFQLVAGRLTENIPSFVRERAGTQPLEIVVDVRHAEVAKLESLGLNPLVYSLIGTFCREYLGPSLKRWSPRFFGDGALNLELFSKRRSELWLLVKDDIGVVRRGGQRQVVTRADVIVVNVADQQVPPPSGADRRHRLLLIADEDQRTGLAGYYIRLPSWAFDAYGDLVAGCDTHGVVWAGNKMTFVASDGVSAQFQYEIRLDEIVSTAVDGVARAEGALELDRPLQEMFGGVYFPIPASLERFLVPGGGDEIRLDLHCEWIDMRTRKLWEAETPKEGAQENA